MTLGPDRRTLMRYSMLPQMFEESGESGGGKEPPVTPPAKKEGESGDKGDKGFKPITTQEDLDAIIDRRLDRFRRKAKDELRSEVEEEVRAEAQAEAAKEQGDYKALYEAEVKKNEKLEGEKKAREHEELRQKVAKAAGLPDESMEFLVGKDEDELKASAKKLASMLKAEPAADTDLGNSNKTGRGKTPPKADYTDPGFWGIEVIPDKKE